MKTLTLAAIAIGFTCSTAAWAAPLPSNTVGIGQTTTSDIVQVKKKSKKMSKKMMMKNEGDMSGQGSNMGSGSMQGGQGGMAKPQ